MRKPPGVDWLPTPKVSGTRISKVTWPREGGTPSPPGMKCLRACSGWWVTLQLPPASCSPPLLSPRLSASTAGGPVGGRDTVIQDSPKHFGPSRLPHFVLPVCPSIGVRWLRSHQGYVCVCVGAGKGVFSAPVAGGGERRPA